MHGVLTTGQLGNSYDHPFKNCTSTPASLVTQLVKESAYNSGDPGLIPGSGRAPEERNGFPLQYSCLENSMERGAWWATVHGVAKSQRQLSDFHFPDPCIPFALCWFYFFLLHLSQKWTVAHQAPLFMYIFLGQSIKP